MSEISDIIANQFLTFTLDEEVFALDIATVREVLEYTSITKIPRTPTFMRGIINLRGHGVPVVDLRLKFGMSKTERTVNTCIIITEVAIDGEITVLGALADSVREVFEMEPGQIEPPPRMGTKLKSDYIKGIGKHADQFIIILDVNKIFTPEELAQVAQAGAASQEAEEEPELAAV